MFYQDSHKIRPTWRSAPPPGSAAVAGIGATTGLEGGGSPRGAQDPSGSRTRTTVAPGADSTPISPPCRSTTMRREMSRPRPVPLPTSLVVKNGSKAWACTSAACRSRCRRSRPRRGGVGGRADGQGAGAVHGVDGVVDEVGPDLVELAGIGGDRWRPSIVVPPTVMPVAQLVAHHHQRAVEAVDEAVVWTVARSIWE